MCRCAIQCAAILLVGLLVISVQWSVAQSAQVVTRPSIVRYDRGAGPGSQQATPSVDWLSTVQDAISRSEYQITWQDRTALPDLSAAYQAPNRAHGLRTYFTPSGIRVIPRTSTGSAPEWEWGVRLVQYGFEGELRSVATARLIAKSNRIEYRRGSITEWYVNDEQGLEQGFILGTPPKATSRRRWINVVLGVTGTLASAATDGQTIELTTAGGVRVLQYGKLRAADATGRPLAAQMVVDRSSIRLRVDTVAAVYPITIDPLTTSPSWTAESNQVSAGFGYSVGTAGDVNGDGYADVIVGAGAYDNGQIDEGRAFVYHGSASGLSASAAWMAEGNQADAFFGSSAGTAGDVNGDGYADVIVSAVGYDNDQNDEGRVFVYQGSASGLNASAAWTAEGNQAKADFGRSAGAAGDVNGDGYADVIVGATDYDNDQFNEGRAFVYQGSASGLSASAAWTAEGNQMTAFFGWSVGTAGDVNGDGYADVIVGAFAYDNGRSNEGRASVYHGSASGLSASAVWTAEGNQDQANFGYSVATAGDVNGDGYADVIIGAVGYNNGQTDEGRAFVYHGSASGLSASAVWTAESNQTNAFFGGSVATAGDVNGDGYADVIVGARWYDNGEPDEGRALVYQGSAGGLSASAVWTAEGNQDQANFGYSVATAGDVNGDGYADVIIGAINYDNGQFAEGRAYVYDGSASGLKVSAGWTSEGEQASAQFGYSVETAGDVNGDGYADVIVGAPAYDNGQVDEGRAFVHLGSASGLSPNAAWTAEGNQAGARFGASAGTAGDVNGDGYADVIVGAPFYDNGQIDEGRVFIYQGSASGLRTTSNWRAESDQADARFGSLVGSAGDVNGDGFGDVIVGAPLYDGGQIDEGRVFIYHGSSSGASVAPNWSRESNQVGAQFGASAGTAGDVNRDGYSDVIVGAPLYDNNPADEGRAFVYHGSAGGLSMSAAWTAESNQADARFGTSVGTAGDVNGDGYSEVIVGAPLYDNGQLDEGRVFVYQGSSSGLGAAPTWTRESNQAGAQLGASVGTAGDVNGDGYAEVIVGAPLYDNTPPNEGRAFVHHGSASGLIAKAVWTAESNQTGAQFGASVASAGDVNGDGYADVIVGAPGYDNGQTDEGRAYVYYGNDGPGVSLRPRQRRTGNSGPIAHLGKSNSSSGFLLMLLGRTPFGRGKVKLEVEVKPLGTRFNGLGTLQTLSWQDTGVAGVELLRLVSGLASATAYHWRVRLLYHPAQVPFQQHSRWLTMPWNGWNEKDLRTY